MGEIYKILEVWSPHRSHLPFFEEMLHAHHGPLQGCLVVATGNRVTECLPVLFSHWWVTLLHPPLSLSPQECV